jgi:hypothetical protein
MIARRDLHRASSLLHFRPRSFISFDRIAGIDQKTRAVAGVAELVDARDSKSRFFGSVGSIPTAGTGFFCSVWRLSPFKHWYSRLPGI